MNRNPFLTGLTGFASILQNPVNPVRKTHSPVCPCRPGLVSALRSGFSLMEVSFALLIAAVGLLALLSLFPVGLRQGQQASSDTTQAAFAEMVLNAMQANANTITNWNQWCNFFTNNVMQGISAPIVNGSPVPIYPEQNVPHPLLQPSDLATKGYLVRGCYLAYRLDVWQDLSPSIWWASIQVIDRPYALIENSPVYVTAFVFKGM